MNSWFKYLSSPMTCRMGLPPMVPWLTSGYWVEEWLPQMITFCTSLTETLAFSAICPRALGELSYENHS